MHTRHPIPAFYSRAPALNRGWSVLGAAALALLLASGCRSMEMVQPPAHASRMPNTGAPMQDVRTEAKIIEMENEYIAEKNSQPGHQYEAEQKAKKKAQQKAEQEKQAKAIKAAEQQAAKSAPAEVK